MNAQRPVNLDLTKFKFPLMAIVSILHRISGVVIFLSLPILMYLLHQSLLSQNTFLQTQYLLTHPLMRLLMWGILVAVLFHLLAGIRHLIMDLGFFESVEAGHRTAVLVIVLTLVLAVLVGVWI